MPAALEIDEKVLGPNHVTLITRLNYLGRCMKKLGAADEAARCYERAAGILRQMRDPSAAGAGDDALARQQQDHGGVFAAPAM